MKFTIIIELHEDDKDHDGNPIRDGNAIRRELAAEGWDVKEVALTEPAEHEPACRMLIPWPIDPGRSDLCRCTLATGCVRGPLRGTTSDVLPDVTTPTPPAKGT